MVLKIKLQWVIVAFLLTFRFTTTKISPSSRQLQNKIDLYVSPYVDKTFCRTIPGLTKYQIELCAQQPDTTMVALQGLNQAVKECQYQFQKHKWNCSSLSTRGKNPYISAMFQRGYKETAFAYAISSASVAISVAKACSSASLRNCGCDSKIYKFRKSRRTIREDRNDAFKESDFFSKAGGAQGDELSKISGSFSSDNFSKEGGSGVKAISWKWGGCSHNLKYGIRFSKMFLDSREKADDIHSRINLHNNHVGRMAVSNNMQVRCKCHGISGSCQMKTCWRAAPDFRVIGKILKEKFNSAILVDQSNLGNKNLRRFNVANPRSENKKRKNNKVKEQWTPRKNKKKRDLSFDLLYYQKSPNFCEKDPVLDVLGTSGRFCNRTNIGSPDSCSSLCCGRGYNLIREKKIERCNCKFIWCCRVECQYCKVENWISACK